MKVWIRGAGELASAVAVTLKRCGFAVILSELNRPLAIRRTVTFSDALLEGTAAVEGLRARKVSRIDSGRWKAGEIIPVGVDQPDVFEKLNPDVYIDGRMLKKALPDGRHVAPLTVGLGPGFTVGENCHAAIETHRGHDLGRVLWNGAPLPDTAVPGNLGGATRKRVLYAPESGRVRWEVNFGDLVTSGDPLGVINETTVVCAAVDGQVRGLIHPLTPIVKGLKIADVDPRG
ncbi:MAG: EF2563 family selenium-dependent molybdenum hydroxylase system protein, partial [FCB group bacterium]|nr:EF2563 family selenium-dependent molybdenum hydroxylase system protein [FCB group bacterium]